MIGGICNAETALISNILAESETAVCLGAGSDFNAVKLCDELVGESVKSLGIGCGPPVGEVTVFVELTTLIVEAVCHFMTDHHTDGAVVDGVVSLGIKERSLQNTCREADFVCSGIVVCVDGLGRHVPAAAVYGFAVVCIVVVLIEEDGILDILPVRQFRVNGKSRIIAPFVRIADLHGESGQFLLCAGLCRVAHPCKIVDMLPTRASIFSFEVAGKYFST